MRCSCRIPLLHQTTNAEPVPLLHRFTVDGRLIARQLPGVLGAFTQAAVMTAGPRGEIAVYRPDMRTVYWLDSEGQEIQSFRFWDSVTALALIGENLLVAVVETEPLPSQPGVFASKMKKPRAYEIGRDGRREEIHLPPEAVVINQIGADGNLFQVLRDSITVFRVD